MSQELIDTRPEDMPLELVHILDRFTTTQIGSWVLWWMKTVGERLGLITEDVNEHKIAQAAIDWKAVETERVKTIIARLRQEAKTMEEDLTTRLVKEELEEQEQGIPGSDAFPGSDGIPTGGAGIYLGGIGATSRVPDKIVEIDPASEEGEKLLKDREDV